MEKGTPGLAFDPIIACSIMMDNNMHGKRTVCQFQKAHGLAAREQIRNTPNLQFLPFYQSTQGLHCFQLHPSYDLTLIRRNEDQ